VRPRRKDEGIPLPPIGLILHPDERRAGSSSRGVYAAGCCCCSCCCCCVHTIGGLVGAAIGSRPPKPRPVPTDVEAGAPMREPAPQSAASVYWMVLLGVCTFSTIVFAILPGWDIERWQESLLEGGLMTLIVLPALQWVASGATALGFVAFRTHDPPWRSLRRITWLSFLWSLVGLGPSIFIFYLLVQ
jgi:hypothetical protein